MSKSGLVVEGGGMKCAYSAGILDAFLDHQITFDYVIGVSAGCANAASFLAGQRGRNRRFYTEFIHDPGYMGVKNFLKTGSYFGLQYIYGTLTNTDGAAPLDFDAVLKNPAEYVVVATDAETGKPCYFRKEEMEKNNYRHIMASCCLPALTQPVRIDGRAYYDGGVSDAIPIRQAIRDGCDRLVIIRSKTRDFVKKPEGMKGFYTLACRRYPAMIRALDRRHIMYRREQADQDALEKMGRCFVFAPSDPPKMSTFSRDAAVEESLYELGLKDFARLKESFKDWLGQSDIQ